MTDRNNFGWGTTADEVLEGIDLTGKLVLITGGSSGLGAETARAMAAKGAKVIVTARNLEKARGVADEIKNSTGADIEIEELELASFENIRGFAERFLAKHEKLDLLINNAGVMACPETKTTDGFEMQFGTNHLGHFLLTGLLAPALIKAAPARIVSLSSAGHQFSPVVFDDIQFENREYDKWMSYGQSKTANVLYSVGLNDRLKEDGVEAFAVHPGGIMTDLARHMTDDDMAMFEDRLESGELEFKTVEAGAATQVFAATAPEIEGRGGSYLADCGICEVDDEVEFMTKKSQTIVRSYAVDRQNADRLWEMSEEMVGQKFVFRGDRVSGASN